MFKVTFFLVSLVTGQQEIVLDGSESYSSIGSCKAAAEFVAQNSPAGYKTTWECKKQITTAATE